MDTERARAFLSSLPNVVETISETERWGNKLVYRIGGKMFSQIDFLEDGRAVLSFATDPAQFPDLVERDGIVPAPYRARLYWIALMRWDAMRDAELKELLRNARAIVFAKLPRGVREKL